MEFLALYVENRSQITCYQVLCPPDDDKSVTKKKHTSSLFLCACWLLVSYNTSLMFELYWGPAKKTLVFRFSQEMWNSKPEFLLESYGLSSSNKRWIWLNLVSTAIRKFNSNTIPLFFHECVTAWNETYLTVTLVVFQARSFSLV